MWDISIKMVPCYTNTAQHESYLVKNDDLDFVAIPLLITDIMAKYIWTEIKDPFYICNEMNRDILFQLITRTNTGINNDREKWQILQSDYTPNLTSLSSSVRGYMYPYLRSPDYHITWPINICN